MASPAVEAEPKGLLYVPEFLNEAEEAKLVELVEGLSFDEVVMQGQTAKRDVVHLGFRYGYDSWELRPGPPIPPELDWLRLKCGDLAGIDPERLDEALVTRYPPGAGIGWHRDAPMFGSRVIGVSLASESRMRFQRKVAGIRYVHDLDLAPGSAYVLAEEVRWAWRHSIPPVKSLRYSITFRTVRDPARWSS
jgi:alkylated DNA repair protein (DNA oxidative demethylase)